jgi:flagellar L-ring protein FlgH
MTPTRPRQMLRLAALLLAATSLSACGDTLTRLSKVGQAPEVSPVQNPAERQNYVTMPMPTPVPVERGANSLWRPGASAFLKDRRASQTGDIVTVVVNRTDTATFSNDTSRTRTNTNTANATTMLGYETTLWNRLPGPQAAVTPASLLNLGSTLNNAATTDMARSEAVNMQIAAVVTQVLPNGNLVIHGSQEIRVNFETRVVGVGGVIRPTDIQSTNQIAFERIAEARLSYGGRGQHTDVQQPRWGDQILDIIFPF